MGSTHILPLAAVAHGEIGPMAGETLTWSHSEVPVVYEEGASDDKSS
jgi:hypothetical protein